MFCGWEELSGVWIGVGWLYTCLVTVLCDFFSWGDTTRVYSPQLADARRSYRPLKSNMVNQRVSLGLLKGAAVTQRQLHYQSPPQQWRQLTKAGNLEHTVYPAGSSSDWRVSIPSDSVGLNLLQTTELVYASSSQILTS